MRFGRKSTFEARFAPISDRLYAYGMALTRDRDAAADLFQDCVVRAISANTVPIDDRAFRAWLFAIMRNLWIDRLRRDQRAQSFEALLSDDGAGMAQMPMPLEAVVVNQLAVREAFACLSLQHRDVLALIDIAGFRYEEAADMLGVPKGTVMSRVSRARQALLALLADDRVVELPRRKGRIDNE